MRATNLFLFPFPACLFVSISGQRESTYSGSFLLSLSLPISSLGTAVFCCLSWKIGQVKPSTQDAGRTSMGGGGGGGGSWVAAAGDVSVWQYRETLFSQAKSARSESFKCIRTKSDWVYALYRKGPSFARLKIHPEVGHLIFSKSPTNLQLVEVGSTADRHTNVETGTSS